MIGQRLLHYQITEKLGEGGMGVVYKARDTHLDRFVAIKVLPRDKISDAARKARFVQEAKAASALNHPNIITVHDIAEDKAGVVSHDFIVMEYVAGKTLDQIIPRKGMRLNEALKISVQIADALACAHGAGIIHRDLKPSNIMVGVHGLVKVLDFGLAKLTGHATLEDASTATLGVKTDEGAIVGTAAYMSPEQAEGKPLDARSDIFSFGSMLYEMVTGQRAFQGGSTMSTLSAVLHKEPTPLAAETPHDLSKLITRCLRKDPDKRFHHMVDLKVVLEELKEESDSDLSVPSPPLRRIARRRWVVTLSLVAAGALLASIPLVKFVRPRTAPRAGPPVAVPLTSYPGIEHQPGFSPDGRQVAFSWDGETQDNFDIYVKLIGSEPPLRLTSDPHPDYNPAWSPDGQWIAFLRELESAAGGIVRAELLVVPPLGGPERKLGEVKCRGYVCESPIAWAPDGKGLVVADSSAAGKPPGLSLLTLATGQRQSLTTPPAGSFGDDWPAFSPDGRSLSFVRAGRLYLARLSSDLRAVGEPRPLTWVERHVDSYAWTVDGRGIVFSSSDPQGASLWRVAAFEPYPPEQLTFGEEAFDVVVALQRGRLAYARRIYDSNIWHLELDETPGGRKGESTKLIASTRPDDFAEYSPDGQRIVFVSSRSGVREVWVCRQDGSNPQMLTSLGGVSDQPRWSSDGRRVLFAFRGHIYVIDSSGGIPQRLTSDPVAGSAPNWSQDGEWIYFTSSHSGQAQIWKMPAAGGVPAQLTRAGGEFPAASPDGRFVLYIKRRDLVTGTLWKVPAGGGEETKILEAVAASAGFALVERGIYFIPAGSPDQPAVLQFLDFASGSISPAAQLTMRGRMIARGLSVSQDHRHVLYSVHELQMDLMLVENFR